MYTFCRNKVFDVYWVSTYLTGELFKLLILMYCTRVLSVKSQGFTQIFPLHL